MEILELRNFSDLQLKNQEISQLVSIFALIQRENLPETIVRKINVYIKEINALEVINPAMIRPLKLRKQKIMDILEKEGGYVLKGHYPSLWTSLGIAVFGIPLGVIFGLALKNMAFIGIGIPIGLAIGIVVGNQMEKKAQLKGKLLNL